MSDRRNRKTSNKAADSPVNSGELPTTDDWRESEVVKALDECGAMTPFEVEVDGRPCLCILSQHGQLFHHPEMKLVTGAVGKWRAPSPTG